ncbi:hypothetical protein [Bradyrhizobium sp.]|uniref:hypothetical protein n=1 Tax=Bradyrhizobium sp. TaxID=376 RepID=UPI0025B7EE39|nr:hypothetical protein [Bradyrhizobium sp.]
MTKMASPVGQILGISAAATNIAAHCNQRATIGKVAREERVIRLTALGSAAAGVDQCNFSIALMPEKWA